MDVGGIGTPIAENVRIHHQPLGALRQVVRARVGLAEDKPAESPITVLNFNKKIESRKCATNSTASMKFGVQILCILHADRKLEGVDTRSSVLKIATDQIFGKRSGHEEALRQHGPTVVQHDQQDRHRLRDVRPQRRVWLEEPQDQD